MLMSPENEVALNEFFGLQMSEQQTLRSNESFTDSYACLLNIFMATKFLFDGKVDSIAERCVFCYLVSKEWIYIVGKAFKLFPVLGLEISARTKTIINKCQKRREHTHVISYYILKALNFVNLIEFLNFLRINKYTSQEDGIAYIHHLQILLKQRWETPKVNLFDITKCQIKKTINKKLNNFLKRILKIEHDNWSLRMSCIDVSAI
jgi:hypothetical protein